MLRRGGARPRPRSTSGAARAPVGGRRPRARHRDPPPRHPARRHRSRAVYAYGAYGYTFEPEWDPALPSLLDRGVVYAHAHVRGGGERGRAGGSTASWEPSSTRSTTTSPSPTASPAGLVDGDRIATRGLSAGGLLQGAVFSQRPDRWRAVVAEVPFVDVVTTMFDASIPLTVNEWDEWGDPRVRDIRLDARLLAVRQPPPGRRRAPTCWSPARCTTRA